MPHVSISRRTAGLAAASMLAAGWFAVPRVSPLFAGDFEFEPMSRPEGFRRIAAGQVSTGYDMLVGLDDNRDDQIAQVVERVRAAPCAALFDGEPLVPGTIPIASFSDYNCPYCRILTPKLAQIEASSNGGVKVFWHELPLLGETSLTAAKGALAAKRQDAYVAFQERLLKSGFRMTREYLKAVAENLEVDGERMIADMQSAAVAEEIARSRALARVFGFIGTPALVVGRTVVQGEIREAKLVRLIERERDDGAIAACDARA